MIPTRNISVTISEPDGSPIAGAKVQVKLVGLGNGVGGAVAPGIQSRVTNAAGYCVFRLWQNEQDYSDTYYEITSQHPTTKRAIHNKAIFRVGEDDADVKTLLTLGAQAAPGSAASGNAEIAVRITAGVATVVRLGPLYESDGTPILYSPGSPGTQVVGANQGFVTAAAAGTEVFWFSAQSGQGVTPVRVTAQVDAPSLQETVLSGVEILGDEDSIPVLVMPPPQSDFYTVSVTQPITVQ